MEPSEAFRVNSGTASNSLSLDQVDTCAIASLNRLFDTLLTTVINSIAIPSNPVEDNQAAKFLTNDVTQSLPIYMRGQKTVLEG